MEVLKPEWRCFIEAARTGSFSRAGDRLKLPQPSVSKYLQKLELSLGTSLFERGNRGIRLTDTGTKLYEKLQSLSSSIEEEIERALKSSNEISGTVKLGAHRAIAQHYLPASVRILYKRHPGLRVELELASSPEIARLVAAGRLEYGLVANPLPLQGLVKRICAIEDVAIFSNSDGSFSQFERVFYNPEMQFLPRVLRKIRQTPLEAVGDYDLAGSLTGSIPGSGALLPETVARRSGLNYRNSPVFFRAKISLIFRAEMKRTARHLAIIDSFLIDQAN